MAVRLAFIAGQLGLGGAEQQLYYLLSGIDRSRFRPIVISLGKQPGEYWEQPIKDLGIPLWHILASRALRVLRITRILRAEKVQLVHSWDLHTNPYAVLACQLARVRLCIGSMRFNCDVSLNAPRLGWCGYRGFDLLITNSAMAAKQVYERELTTASVKVLPNGVTIPTLVGCHERANLRSELGFPNDDLVIGSIGRLDHNKNYAMLLRVFASLTARWNNLRLMIIGDGPLRHELNSMASTLGVSGKTHFFRSMPAAAKWLPVLDVCCLTSLTEGMPNVVMEAAAAGVPVVATNCGGSVELVDHGTSGFLVAPGAEAEMASYLDQLLRCPNLRSRMGHAGREKMLCEFSVERMIHRMTAIYEEQLVVKEIGEHTALSTV